VIAKPLFLRGDYDTAVFGAFKQVEVRVRKKAGLATEYGRSLMLKAFGEAGPLTAGNKDDRSATRELFAGAISFFKNPPSHHEIQFENPREVVVATGTSWPTESGTSKIGWIAAKCCYRVERSV
jgi:uncharacterized protein (TIGR02391 family)